MGIKTKMNRNWKKKDKNRILYVRGQKNQNESVDQNIID